MRWICFLMLLVSMNSFGQWKDYTIAPNGDTLNRVDMNGLKQGPWVVKYDKIRGEPGYEEEGFFVNNRKEGEWKMYSLVGDLIGIENYKWGLKDGVCSYFNMDGNLRAEQSWKALNPDKQYDTIMVEDVDLFDTYKKVVVKNEGAALRHGTWKYYDGATGFVQRTERYELGRLITEPVAEQQQTQKKKAVEKPKEVLEFEKKNAGKKKIRYKDGSAF
jgi:hypothetical protein